MATTVDGQNAGPDRRRASGTTPIGSGYGSR